jgi:hypothetical protein
MAQFVLITSGVTDADFEKAMEIKIRAQEKVLFVPQNSDHHGVQSLGMYSAKPNPSAKEELLNLVRFEWNQAGAEFGAEIVRVLAGHQRQEAEQHERAA